MLFSDNSLFQCLSLSAAVQISTEGPDVHIFFVRYLRPSYDLVERAADGAFLNFLIFGLLGYQALLCASLALGDQLNVMVKVILNIVPPQWHKKNS